MEKQKKNRRGLKLVILIFLAIILVVAMFSEDNTSPQAQQEPQTQIRETVKRLPPKEVSYRIIEEEDISYINCKRIGVRIVVPDDSLQTDVNYTLQEIVNKHKTDWDDITVWAYKDSEEKMVGLIPYSMGIKEYSSCN